MPKKWRLTDRTKMLLKLELAITLPALALMAFSIWNLKHIQRDQAIEAAIQRDLTSLLKFTEKKTWLKANDIVEPVRKVFPSPDENAAKIKAQLDHILAEHPEFAFAILYDKTEQPHDQPCPVRCWPRRPVLRTRPGQHQQPHQLASHGCSRNGPTPPENGRTHGLLRRLGGKGGSPLLRQ